MASHFFVGTWEIVECKPSFTLPGNHVDKELLEGTVMTLDESGDVTWNVKRGSEDLPLFASDTYDISSDQSHELVIHFGACGGHVIEFRVTPKFDPKFMQMSEIESWCTLQCKRVNASEANLITDAPFSLLPALEDGYFTDLTITASNSKKFAVHTCILKLLAPGIDWNQEPPPLSGLPEDVLGTILHYLYAECLPSNLSEETARQCITAVSSYPCLAPFVSLCQHYLRNTSLKQQFMDLVNDMHTCASQIIQHFSIKHSPSTSESLSNNPAKLWFVYWQSIQEAAVAGVKLLVLCDLFSKRKSELTSEQRHEIIRYAKSRLPVFMNQLRRFLVSLKSTFSCLSPTQSQEIATYLIPEVEKVFEIASSLGLEIESALEQIMTVIFKDGHTLIKRKMIMSLKEVLQYREMNRLKSFSQRHKHSLQQLRQRTERFNEMTNVNKVRLISRSLEQFIEEIPIFLLRLEEITGALDDKLGWRDFKFCFKVGSSKVFDFVHKLKEHKNMLRPVLNQLCDLVARDAFSESLVTLGLLDRVPCPTTANEPTSSTPACEYTTTNTHLSKLNLVESLCVPPLSMSSHLSKAAIDLLKSGLGTDMVFEITPTQDVQDSAVSSPSAEQAVAAIAVSPSAAGEEVCCLRAHRLIVAARCDWFRRALLSGMREAIDRKIVIIDTSPKLFSILVEYLYSGHLESPIRLTTDQLSDLLYAADRYEVDSLKTACEQGLKSHIDSDTVLYFLSLGDQFNAKLLKSSCLNFISLHPDIMDSELFEELPQNLQTEIYDLMIWGNRRKSEKPNAQSSSLSQLANEMSTNMRVSHSNSMQDIPRDSARLEACLSELTSVIGDLASRTELVQLALAADYDLNRALNFFFSSS